MGNISFIPVRGLEAVIMTMGYNEGFVYFATDTKKIYVDANGQEKIPMGGNSGIYYGRMVLEETPDSGQKEFTFSIYDIEGNDDPSSLTIPNIDDLILNIPDGCFYRVNSIEQSEEDILILTEKLTIAGSGGGGGSEGGGGTTSGTVTMDRLTSQTATILYEEPYEIGFNLYAADSSGEQTGSGTYDLYVNGVKKKANAVAKQGPNYVDVSPYLILGKNTVRVSASMDIGGASNVTVSKSWSLTTTELKAVWEYDETTVNSTEQNFVIEWVATGLGLSKTTHIIIDGEIHLTTTPTNTTSTQQYIIETSKMVEYNLTHGSHTFEMYITAEVDGTELPPTKSVYKNIMFAQPGNTLPIINVGAPTEKLTQYNTIQIPVTVYILNNVAGTATVVLKENSVIKDTWTNIKNQETHYWAYTPTSSGMLPLAVQCGQTEKTFTVEIEAVDIDINEVSGYAFKFKANEFASNTAIQNWTDGTASVSFSPKFDWINGGLGSERDEVGGTRQFVKIKAGSEMTINYPLMASNATAKGKTLKVIFKATNCRDYDAQVLSCKRDIKTIYVNRDEEELKVIDNGTELQYSSIAIVQDGEVALYNPQTAIFDLTSETSRNTFKESYVILEGKMYQCHFAEVEKEKEDDPTTYYAYWYKVTVEDSFEGVLLNAQSATFKSKNNSISTQYCEDCYIELEFDISKYDETGIKNYIKFWIDGVPAGFVIYDSTDSFIDNNNVPITIGSADCDVNIYTIKLYEKGLTNDEHLQNFIADAPNAEEMVSRFRRNDILDEHGEISPTLLATANPDCLVHVYDIPRMTRTKKDKVDNCTYTQYHGSDQAVLSADTVTIKVQGTSSEKYVVAAANIDSNFKNGFIDQNGQHLDGWSMDGGNAIPCDFFCTKVNVASCENANNALNQEWYNLFQPYKSVLRCKNEKARDTMQFTNGVLFMLDRNKTFSTDTNADKKNNNVFGEITGYLNNPYPKLYSLANMGNSKKNIHVFHDTENPLECCVEVGDNQTQQQWMVSDVYNKSDMGDKEGYFEFRYPDGIDEVKKLATGQQMIDGWNNFVTWMAHSNPQPKYQKHTAKTEKEFRAFAFNQKTQKPVSVYVLNPQKTNYVKVTAFDNSISEYYTETAHIYGYTNLPLGETKHFDPYTFRGFRAENQKDENGDLWQKDYTPLIAGYTISTYAGDYTHDTYEYRMAKMISECEDHLIMDSVIYHYLFIERHCMIDNVAKNTFWSTEDCQHWNLIKDYDNDTADGNDNNGKFTRTYGMEPGDKLNSNTYVFNAHESVWLNFIGGLQGPCEHLYQKLEEQTIRYHDRDISIWSKNDYLWLFKDWQSRIPERCWIEDYYRKYFRPYELYNDTMFISMMEGGKKTQQREQFETYQETYMSSEYNGKEHQSSYLLVRSSGDNMLGYELPVKTYSDCYIRMHTGSDMSVQRVKRNTEAAFVCPTNKLNNATMYFYPAKAFSEIGSIEEGKGVLGELLPEQVSFASAGKLRKLIVGRENTTINKSLKRGFAVNNNTLLETLYVCNLGSYEEGLDLKNCPNLKEVNAKGSTFTSVEIADGAPVVSIKLQSPTALTLSNLTELNTLDVGYDKLAILNINNIDQSAVSSKTLVENSPVLSNYKLTDIDWVLDNSNDINASDKEINLLEKLLSIRTLEDKGSLAGYIPKAAALTGKIIVDAGAYDSSESIDIYNKYVDNDVYPNLDIDFEGSNADLYSISILNGDGTVYWTKRISQNNNGFDETFLEDGPNGAFNFQDIVKPNTADKVYEFKNQWKVYSADGVNYGTIQGQIPIYNSTIGTDLIFEPDFSESERNYTLSFYESKDATEPFAVINNAKYGDKISDYYPIEIPYKDSSALKLKEAYDFQGYGLIKTATTPISLKATVTNDQNFYAIFKLVEDISTVVHPDWFSYETIGNINLPDGTYIPSGIQIIPKRTLKGKITIPASYNNQKIVSIGDFNNCLGLTHVFMEKGSKVQHIDANTFQNLMELKYFDFSLNTIQYIGESAFLNCPLINTNIGNAVQRVERYAFNGAFCPEVTHLTLPASLRQIDEYAFCYLSIAYGASLQIGSDSAYSYLDFSRSYASDASGIPVFFWQNQAQMFATIVFFSKFYDSPTTKITHSGTGKVFEVEECFRGDNYNASFTINKEGV